jgi:uncharacterized protein (TIGR00730 family)
MKRPLTKPPKAYKDLEFLNSPDARVVRMLSEFLEPQRRFRRARVRDTIVFFGSSRIVPRSDALRRLREVKRKRGKAPRPGSAGAKELAAAQTALEMSRYYEDTVELARLLTSWSKTLNSDNRFVVCSGGGPGIMEAANRGARHAGGPTIGLNISLPFEQFANPYISRGLSFEFHYFFMRKFWFVYLAKALVVFPGGFGTLDELMELLTLLQTEKLKKRLGVVVYGSSYWKKVLNFDEMVRQGVVSRADLRLFKFLDTPQEAFEYLRAFLTHHYVNGGRKKG